MDKGRNLRWLLVIAAFTLVCLTAGCSATGQNSAYPNPQGANTPAGNVFTDPFTYCAAVGTLDAPDARYAGEPVPDAVINGFKLAARLEASTEPMEMFRKTTVWRCMAGKVYACNFGANLPCDSKANTDKSPPQAMADYCRANPGTESIPMSVTGHDTIYSWSCVKDGPQVQGQIAQVDTAGYLAQIWYAIEPSR